MNSRRFVIGLVLVGFSLMSVAAYRSHSPAPKISATIPDIPTNNRTVMRESRFSIMPIAHASAVLMHGDTVIYNDPIGDASEYTTFGEPDLILLSDLHGDHLSVETLAAVVVPKTIIVAPQAVWEQLPAALQTQTRVLANSESTNQFGITIEAVPMYNLPEQGVEIRHEMGRGNGYVLEAAGERLYIAGDTADIPEMRALTDIDIALVPMNVPYTMSVEAAADAVLDFAPAKVIPYHYRTPDGFSDVVLFKRLVNDGNPDIEVELLEWYPASDE